MGNGRKQTWKRVRERESREDLSPSLPNPAPSPFFLAHFSLLFPNYLKACYRLNTYIPSFPTFYGIYSTWASSTFGALLLISRNGFGSTNFSTAFRLRNFFFFLVFFLLFFLCHFLLYFLDLFFDSLPSLTHLSPPPPCPLCSRQEGTTILFCSRPLPRLFRLLGLRKKYGLLCGLKDFALIDVLVSWKL